MADLRFRIDAQHPLRRSTLLLRLSSRLRRVPGRVRYRTGEQKAFAEGTHREAISWARRQLRGAALDKRLIFRLADDTRLVVDVVEVGPVLGDPHFSVGAGDDAITLIVRAAAAAFPKLLSLGGPVCKFISGTRDPSQHCIFGPHDSGCNAWDLALKIGPVYSIRLMWKLAHWLVAHAAELGIDVVIFRDRIWTPSAGWHAYTGVFHAAHVHVNPADRHDLNCTPAAA